MNKGKLVVITGFPGAGKDTLANMLIKNRPEFNMIVSHTSRSKRKGEIHGKHHYFVSKKRFKELIEKDRLLEHVKTGLYFKGTSFKEFNPVLKEGKIIWRIELTRASSLEETFQDRFGIHTSKTILKRTSKILITPGSKKIAIKRYRKRDKKSDIRDFKIRWDFETKHFEKHRHKFPHVVENPEGYPEKAFEKILSIIDNRRNYNP